jgi:hypothetical protein
MRILRKVLLAVVAFAVAAYGCDFLDAKFRPAPTADVHIDRYLAISQKFNKIDYERTDPVTERCVYSIFPHFGSSPCWYLMHHTLRFVKVG